MELTEFKSYGITEKNNTALVSSRVVAEKFNKRHDRLLQTIREMECSHEFRVHNFVESSYKNEQNKRQPEYLMTRDGFVILAMGFTGKKAMRFKEAYINAFNQMESFIRTMLEAKADFPEFTSAIAEAHEEPKPYHFSNELNMINQIVTGMTSKQFKEHHNLGKVNSIRPYLEPEQLEAVKTLQRIDIGLIVAVPDYQQRKEILAQQYERLQQRLLKGA